tara:strand:+ start:707 stop:973 length:267 start_codon:yes stop_codon:yes gene_type:complete
MKHLKLVAVIAVPLLFAAGCETTAQNKDMSALESQVMANKATAEQAAAAANAAAAAAREAAAAARAAAAEAKAASDKADRLFSRNLRK